MTQKAPMTQAPAVTESMLMGPKEASGKYDRGRASKGPHAIPTALDVTNATCTAMLLLRQVLSL